MTVTGEELTVTGEELTVTGEAIASPVNMLKYALGRPLDTPLDLGLMT